ncbi:MAG: hypothetical protein ACI9AF_000604 [Granulosicoccus sp.]|jgi:hypothetical protein
MVNARNEKRKIGDVPLGPSLRAPAARGDYKHKRSIGERAGSRVAFDGG